MKKKCEECRHYDNFDTRPFADGVCLSPFVTRQIAEAIDIRSGREICDREGDGRFVYFEPVGPNAGAVFAMDTVEWNSTAEAVPLVQITRIKHAMARGANV